MRAIWQRTFACVSVVFLFASLSAWGIPNGQEESNEQSGPTTLKESDAWETLKELKRTNKHVPGEVVIGFNGEIPHFVNQMAQECGGFVKRRIEKLAAVVIRIGGIRSGMENIVWGVEEKDLGETRCLDILLQYPSVKYANRNSLHYAHYTPDDPKWIDQWGPMRIEADVAWDITMGHSSVQVAILDTGIHYIHPDLWTRFWGVRGYSCLGGGCGVDGDEGDWNNGHGTHVAGIVAAESDNMVGIAGMARIHLLSVRVLYTIWFPWPGVISINVGTEDSVSDGILTATDHGADVISMSLGSYINHNLIEDACQYAWDAGAVLVASTGNEGLNQVVYPAAYDTVIAVGALNKGNSRAYFSNYGNELDLLAPGVDIWSTVAKFGDPNGYASYSGTSMAAPHVAGTAALMLSYSPGLTNEDVWDYLLDTADDLGVWGWDIGTGYGRVNTYNAVARCTPFTHIHGTVWGEVNMNGREWWPGQGLGVMIEHSPKPPEITDANGKYSLMVRPGTDCFHLGGVEYRCDVQVWTVDPVTLVLIKKLAGKSIVVKPSHTHTLDFYLYLRRDPGGCPYILAWSNGVFHGDNSIMPASENLNRSEIGIVDYFKLEKDLEMDMVTGTYRIVISEFESEESYIDMLSLMTIDHDPDLEVIVSPEGDAHTFDYETLVSPSSATDKDSNDVLFLVDSIDDDGFVGFEGDTLILEFQDANISSNARLLLRSDKEVPPEPLENETMRGPIDVYVMEGPQEWAFVGSVNPRLRMAMDMVNLSSALSNFTQNLKVKLYWNAYHTLDYASLDKSEPGWTEVETNSPVFALHSGDSDVSEDLLESDGIYARLAPGETLEVWFPNTTVPNGTRDFVLVSSGYYVWPGVDVLQQVNLTVRISGTPGNEVTVSVLENRTFGVTAPLNEIALVSQLNHTVEDTDLFDAFVNREYDIHLIYRNHNGGENLIKILLEFGNLSVWKNFTLNESGGPVQVLLVDIDSDLESRMYVADGEIHVTAGVEFGVSPYNLPSSLDNILWSNLTWNFGNITESHEIAPFFVIDDVGWFRIALTLYYECDSLEGQGTGAHQTAIWVYADSD